MAWYSRTRSSLSKIAEVFSRYRGDALSPFKILLAILLSLIWLSARWVY